MNLGHSSYRLEVLCMYCSGGHPCYYVNPLLVIVMSLKLRLVASKTGCKKKKKKTGCILDYGYMFKSDTCL